MEWKEDETLESCDKIAILSFPAYVILGKLFKFLNASYSVTSSVKWDQTRGSPGMQ